MTHPSLSLSHTNTPEARWSIALLDPALHSTGKELALQAGGWGQQGLQSLLHYHELMVTLGRGVCTPTELNLSLCLQVCVRLVHLPVLLSPSECNLCVCVLCACVPPCMSTHLPWAQCHAGL